MAQHYMKTGEERDKAKPSENFLRHDELRESICINSMGTLFLYGLINHIYMLNYPYNQPPLGTNIKKMCKNCLLTMKISPFYILA